LPERRAFSRRLAGLEPSRVLDLGCATGLWLDELDKVLPGECEFIGLDSDQEALAEAIQRAQAWARPASFEKVDLETLGPELPEADLTLLFNLSPYLSSLDELLLCLAARPGHVAIRQYDGAALRFGPMPTEDRAMIEESLRAAVLRSGQFRHYDLDRVFAAIERAPFRTRDVSFELFARTSPFPPEFGDYYASMLDWTLGYLSEAAAERLRSWQAERNANPKLPAYFLEFDLTAVLS
jgi:SAM-dependent methyltransferase